MKLLLQIPSECRKWEGERPQTCETGRAGFRPFPLLAPGSRVVSGRGQLPILTGL